MPSMIDYSNRSPLLFNQNSSSVMGAICKPFFEQSSLTVFAYCRSFNDGRRLYLCNNLKWVEHYIANNLYDDPEHANYYIPQNDINCALWSGFEKDNVFSALYEIDLWHGFSIYEKHSDYIDLFAFGTSRSNSQIVNYYLNNKDTLRLFISEFKEKGADLIDTKDASKLLISKKYIDINSASSNYFVDPKNIQDFIKKTPLGFSGRHEF